MEVNEINYPQFFDLVTRRYSCRGYDNAPVSREMVMAVLSKLRAWHNRLVTASHGCSL